MSGIVFFFNCTQTTLYYAQGSLGSLQGPVPSQPPMIIYPMTAACWSTLEGGEQIFIDDQQNTIVTFNQASLWPSLADNYSCLSLPTSGVINRSLLLTETSVPFNSETWMGDNLAVLGSKTLRELCLPGSHDAGMSTMTSHTTFGQTCNTITQSNNIEGQLNLGTRYFDLRPVLDNSTFYTGHFNEVPIISWQGATGETFQSIVDGINAFTPGKNELIILKISGSKDAGNGYGRFTQEQYKQLFDLLSGINTLYTGTLTQSDLTKNTLNSYVANGSAVLVVVDDSVSVGGKLGAVSFSGYTGKGFFPASSFPLYDSYANAQDVESMASDQFKKMNEQCAAGSYFLLSWTLTQNDAQAATCGLSTASGTAIVSSAGAGALGALAAIFTGGLSLLTGATMGAVAGGIGAQAASASIGLSIHDLAMQANTHLFSKIIPNITPEVFPNILYTDFIENIAPALLSLSISNGSAFTAANPELLTLSHCAGMNQALQSEASSKQTAVAPALLGRNNAFFKQLFCATRNDSKQLLLDCHVNGPDWRTMTDLQQGSNLPVSAAWFKDTLFVAFVNNGQLYLSNSNFWQGKSAVSTSPASNVCTNLAPCLTVWNNQLCLAYTDTNNNVRIVSHANPLDNTPWTALPTTNSSTTMQSTQPPAISSVTLNDGSGNVELLALLFCAEGQVALNFSLYAPGGSSISASTYDNMSCYGPCALTTLGNTLFSCWEESGNIFLYSFDPNTKWQLVNASNLPGTSLPPALWADNTNNRLVLAYGNSADGNHLYLCESTDQGLTWSDPVRLPVQAGSTPSLAHLNGGLSMVFTAYNSTGIYLTPGSYHRGWSGELSTGMSSPFTPALAWFQHKLWMAYVAADGNNTIRMASSSNHINWLDNYSTGFSSAYTPALAVFNNTLYMAYTSPGSLQLNIAFSTDGAKWSSVALAGQSSQDGPALAVHNNTLYLAYRAGDSSNTLYRSSSSDGKTWSAAEAFTGQSSAQIPALASLNGHLHLLYSANDPSNTLYLSSDSDQWSTWPQLQAVSRNSPALTAHDGQLYFLYGNHLPGSNRLPAGASLQPGQSLVSNNGVFSLNLTSDNKVNIQCLITEGSVWYIPFDSIQSLTLGSNGNLQALGTGGNVLWQSNSGGTVPARELLLHDNGTVSIVLNNGVVAWASNNPVLQQLPAAGNNPSQAV